MKINIILSALLLICFIWFNILNFKNKQFEQNYKTLENRQIQNELQYKPLIADLYLLRKENHKLKQAKYIYLHHIRKYPIYKKRLMKLIKERNIEYGLFQNTNKVVKIKNLETK